MIERWVRTSLWGVWLCAAIGCGGAEATSGMTLRHRPAEGSSIRYHVVASERPGDRPGQTVTGMGSLTTARETQVLALEEIHIARGSNVIESDERLELSLRRDAPGEVPPANGSRAAQLLRDAWADGVHFPDGAVEIGERWTLVPVTRALAGQTLSVSRRAQLESEQTGIATLRLEGTTERTPLSDALAVSADLVGRARVRIADGLLVQLDSELEVTLYATSGDAELGRQTSRFVTRIRRIAGPMPGPEEHPRTAPIDATCRARLRALGRRFEHAPRSPIGALDMELREAADGRDLLEAGPMIVGTDAESMRAAAAAADLDRAVVAYIATPYDVQAESLRQWLADVPSYIELRRLVLRPVDPPAPRPSASVASTTDVAAAVQRHLTLCHPAREAFEEHGLRASVRAPLHAGLERCGCETSSLADLEALLDRALGGPALGWIPLR